MGAAVATAYDQHQKMQRVADKLNSSISEIDEKIDFDIKESVINSAIERRAAMKVDELSKGIAEKVKADIESDIKTKVSKAVEEKATVIYDDVYDAIKEKVTAINFEEVKGEVVKRAEKKVSKKLDEGLDGILSSFKKSLNSRLDTVNRIYSDFESIVGKRKSEDDDRFRWINI
jgi:hypothetical protein